IKTQFISKLKSELVYLSSIMNIRYNNLQSSIELPTLRQDGINFKVSSLISYLFEHDINQNITTDELLNIAKTKRNDNQLVEIAVNDGTSKGFIEAVLTELVQNSVDAIRTYKPTSKYINIT